MIYLVSLYQYPRVKPLSDRDTAPIHPALIDRREHWLDLAFRESDLCKTLEGFRPKMKLKYVEVVCFLKNIINYCEIVFTLEVGSRVPKYHFLLIEREKKNNNP